MEVVLVQVESSTEPDCDESWQSTTEYCDKMRISPNTNNMIQLWVDVCIDGHNTFTGKPLKFLLYDQLPTLNHLQPNYGPLSGGYHVHVFGSGFLNTNALAIRILPLPTAQDFESGRADVESTVQPVRFGGVGVKETVDNMKGTHRDAAGNGHDNMRESQNFVRPTGVRCSYHSETEVSFVMPRLLGQQQGQFLVQLSLNMTEFTSPHEQCIFTLYAEHRSHVRGLFPVINGPEDVATSREACRQWRDLQSSRHRQLAGSPDTARNNKRALAFYSFASTRAHIVRPSLRAVLKAIAAEVDEKNCVNLREILAVARECEAPLQGPRPLPSFDGHPALQWASPQSRVDSMPSAATHATPVSASTIMTSSSWQTSTLTLKLQQLLRHKEGRRELLAVLSETFLHVSKSSGRRDGLTYGELCEHLMYVPDVLLKPAALDSAHRLTLFPSSSQVDLLELWQLADPLKSGFVTLHGFISRLKGGKFCIPSQAP